MLKKLKAKGAGSLRSKHRTYVSHEELAAAVEEPTTFFTKMSAYLEDRAQHPTPLKPADKAELLSRMATTSPYFFMSPPLAFEKGLPGGPSGTTPAGRSSSPITL